MEGRRFRRAGSNGKLLQGVTTEYGELQVLRAEYQILHIRFTELSSAKDDISKWLMISTKKNLYAGISNILHLAS